MTISPRRPPDNKKVSYLVILCPGGRNAPCFPSERRARRGVLSAWASQGESRAASQRRTPDAHGVACAVFRERVASSWWHRVLRPRGKVVCASLLERRARARGGRGHGLRVERRRAEAEVFQRRRARARERLCRNLTSGAPRHRRVVVSVAASARRRGVSRPSTRCCPRDRVGSTAWRLTKVHAIFLRIT